MQDYLPPKVQEAFIATLTEFVLLPWREAMRSTLDGASQGGSQVRTLLTPVLRDAFRSPQRAGQCFLMHQMCWLMKVSGSNAPILADAFSLQRLSHGVL